MLEIHKPEEPKERILKFLSAIENVVGQVLNGNGGALNDFNDGLLGNMNTFLGDINGQIAGVQGLLGGASGGGLGDMTNLLGSLTGNITSAMNFTNIKLNVFGELEPQLAVLISIS